MSDSNDSLILKERAELEDAPLLFSDEEIPKIDRTRPKFHCTGERLWRDRSDVYKLIVKLLAEPGVSVRSICVTCHCSDDTVRAVKERENIAIAAQKKVVLSNILHGARLASERLIEVLPTVSGKDAAISLGILVDKGQLLAGEATERIEVNETIDIWTHWQKFVRGEEPSLVSGKFLPAIEGELADSTKKVAETGLTVGNNLPTEDGAENPVIDVETEGDSAAAATATPAGPVER